MLISLLCLHAIQAVAAPTLAGRIGSRVFAVSAIAPAATVLWALWSLPAVLAGDAVTERWEWVSGLGLAVSLRVDAFSLLMVLIISGIGVLVLWYSVGYFRGSAQSGRAAAGLVAFAGAMVGLVVADNLLLLYVFWELTSVTSYLLIGLNDTDQRAREAAQHALLVTVAGGLAMLAGFVLLGQAGGSFSLSALVADPPSGSTAQIGFLLLIGGAVTKSAQVPFHGWLPGAMAAPTPISTYLHSATMVKAGVYLIARVAPVAVVVPGWRPLVVTLGAATLVFGAFRALRQHDLKLLVAYATVSQLGFMMLLFGYGVPELAFAGIAVLLAHALYKATLFMGVGVVDKVTGTRDLRELRGVGRRLPLLLGIVTLACASAAGLPPLLGFVAKEVAVDGLLELHTAAGTVLLLAVILGAALTVAYAGRFLVGGFAGPVGADVLKRPAVAMMGPPLILAAASLLFGVWTGAVRPLVDAAAAAISPGAEVSFVLWHGFTPALAVSAVSVLAGVAVWSAWRRYEPRLRLPALPTAAEVFAASVSMGVRAASRITAVVQHGSQPLYLVTIMLTAMLLPAVALTTGPVLDGDIEATTTPLQLAVAALIAVAAVGTAMVRRRLAAVLLLGSVGYGMSVLFVMQGAPDLALTQLVVESLIVLVFVVVLRLLPRKFKRIEAPFGRPGRLVVAIGVGVFVSGILALSQSVDHPTAASAGQLALALPEGGGRNVVNVILTDFRALDTLGEITVLMVAGVGVASLVRAGQRPDRINRVVNMPPPGRTMILATGARAAFPLTLLFSVFLLFEGHNAPGGGFVGGLVAGAALILRYLVAGTPGLRQTIPAAPSVLLGGGLALAASTGIAGWVWGQAFLEQTTWEAHLPVLGTVKTTSALPFDIGVYFIVVGFVLMLLQTLAEDPT